MSDQIETSEHELQVLTRDLQDMHETAMPTVQRHIAEWGERIQAAQSRRPVNRRLFLLGGGAAVGAVALAACSSSSTGSGAAGGGGSTAPASGGGSTYSGDLKVVALAAALESLGIAAYDMVLQAAGKGAYGTVPPSVATFVTTVRKQHNDHRDAWNSVLTKGGKPPVTTPALSITGAAVAALQGAKTIGDVAKIAVSVEDTAGATYLEAVGAVSDPGGIAVASTIAPIETQHAAILRYVLGQYPVPYTFLSTKDQNAVPPTALTA